MYITFDSNENVIETTEDEDKAYQEKPTGGRVVTYVKG